MIKKNNTRKRAISIKMFVKEYGEDFSEHVKDRLMDLEVRCFLTRKEIANRFDLKHVEHLQYEVLADEEGSSAVCSKEYAYGQLVALDGKLYFSEKCLESKDIKQAPMVSIIYNALSSEGIILDEGSHLKRLDDHNIDFAIDSILSSCPEVSQAYRKILKGMGPNPNNG